MPHQADDICPRPPRLPPQPTEPLSPAIYLSSVYQCHDPAQADSLLGGSTPGHVYSRDGHPNAEQLAEQCRRLHGTERAAVAASGMAALAVAVLSQMERGDHLVVSNQLYGRSLKLLVSELQRLGIGSTVVDTCDLAATSAAFTANSKLLVAETITNPLLRVSDLAALAKIAHAHQASLLIDNTFASPAICRPVEWGADLVLESLTKIMNGHSDVLLGLLGGPERLWQRVPTVVSCWGFTAPPFECWLAGRGLATLHLRVERAAKTAFEAARFLAGRKEITKIHFPGLPEHPDHALAVRQFGSLFGTVVTFDLAGDRAAAEAFIAAARRIPFCPSLGDLSTTLTHPETTSHRGLTAAERAALGITGGTIRLSVGVESADFVLDALTEGLVGVH